MKGLASTAKLWCCNGAEVKHENLIPNELIRVKFPPSNDHEAEVLSVSPSPDRFPFALKKERTLETSASTVIFSRW